MLVALNFCYYNIYIFHKFVTLKKQGMHERKMKRKTLFHQPEGGCCTCPGFPIVRGLRPRANGPKVRGLFSLEIKK